jgi:FkbM family methyltransferase
MLIDRFLSWLPREPPASPIILDVGSCTGQQACEFAAQFPTARIYAFEAHPDSVAKMRQTVGGFENIAVVEGAVHEFDGKTTFYAVDDFNPGASSLFEGSGVLEVQPIRQRPVTVSALRLDTWARGAGIGRFDWVWMDLQGAELLALRGMGDLLATVQAMQLEITYRELYRGQALWPEVLAYLHRQGFRLVDEWPDPCGYFGDAVLLRG